MCSLSAINLSAAEMAVFMINCLYSIHSLLSLYEYTDAKLEKLEAQVFHSDKTFFFIVILMILLQISDGRSHGYPSKRAIGANSH